MKAGDDGFSRFAFSPTLLLSYRLNKRNMLRLRLDSETSMPDIQQMSGNRILIMENFYRRGSADVHNSTGYQSRLIYSYNIPRKLIVQADAHYNRTGASFMTRSCRMAGRGTLRRGTPIIIPRQV